ncbi:MAG: hypothetical protein K6C69_07115 [Lachnospiraceae bacterium]|nr:hypothetical protein [Lachnospiraceae bacterium]
MVKIEKERIQKTLESVMRLLTLLPQEGMEDRIQILTKCQEAVISVGEKLEGMTKKVDQEAIMQYGIIHELEEFCEGVFLASQPECLEEEEAFVRKLVSMKALLTNVIVELNQIPRTYRVVFLPYKAAMWDSLESVWKAFAKDEYCETVVLPVPYFEMNRKDQQWDTRYDGNDFPKDVPVVSFEEYFLEDMRPDLAFTHNPFDEHNNVTMIHPAFHSQELKKHCGKVVYIPYYFNSGYISEDYLYLPLLERVDYIIVQSDKAKESTRSMPYYERCIPLGSPKCDKLVSMMKEAIEPPKEWGMDFHGKKSLLLNTTITDFLVHGEKLLKKLRLFFQKVASMEDIVLVWRPHPLLEGTIKAMRPQLWDGYQELLAFFKENQVGVFDTTPDISRAVVVTDGYVGSAYSSVVDLYQVSGKPAFLFRSDCIFDISQKPDRTADSAFQAFRYLETMHYYAAYEDWNYLFEDFVEDLIHDRLGEVKAQQMIYEEGHLNNMDGTAGEKIYEFLKKELAQET